MKQLIFLICASLLILFTTSCVQQNSSEEKLKQSKADVENLIMLMSKNPDSVGLRLVIANKLDSIGEYKKALLHIDTLIQEDSAKYGLWMAKADILLDSGDANSAKNVLKKAIAIYPGNEALTELAEIYANQKNDSSLFIAKSFNSSCLAYSDYISGLYNYNEDNFIKADSLVNKAIATDRAFVKPYILKANIFLHNGKPQDAINILKQGLKEEPKNITCLNLIGNTFLQIKQQDSAKVYFDKSLLAKAFQPMITEKIKTL